MNFSSLDDAASFSQTYSGVIPDLNLVYTNQGIFFSVFFFLGA